MPLATYSHFQQYSVCNSSTSKHTMPSHSKTPSRKSSTSKSHSTSTSSSSRTSSPKQRDGRYPSLAFAGAMNIPLKSPPSLQQSPVLPSLSSSPSSSSDESSSAKSSPSSSRASSSSRSSTSSVDSRPRTPVSPFTTSSGYASCAFPDWPKTDSLSPMPSPSAKSANRVAVHKDSLPLHLSLSTGQQASSYISDEDLLDLETLPLYNNIRIPVEMLVAKTPESYKDTRRQRRRGPQPTETTKEKHSKKSTSSKKKETSAPVQPSAAPAQPQVSVAGPKRRRRSSPLKRKKVVMGMSPIAEASSE